MKYLSILISIIVFMTFNSCTDFLFFGDSNSNSKDIEDMDLREVAIAIDKEVGEAQADHVSQCKILPIGAKPCGGPWGYLVFSEKESSESKLKKLIERYDELDEIRNREEGLVSTCDVAQPPKVIVENGRCKGEGPYAWDPGYILEINGIEN